MTNIGEPHRDIDDLHRQLSACRADAGMTTLESLQAQGVYLCHRDGHVLTGPECVAAIKAAIQKTIITIPLGTTRLPGALSIDGDVRCIAEDTENVESDIKAWRDEYEPDSDPNRPAFFSNIRRAVAVIFNRR